MKNIIIIIMHHDFSFRLFLRLFATAVDLTDEEINGLTTPVKKMWLQLPTLELMVLTQ
ncbi:MAG: hypothetical protein L6V93_13220 [Clostridiales bacterium]|nr:MAG: hypothetical protein L6V93_13220 [Clostridiales bacterium]